MSFNLLSHFNYRFGSTDFDYDANGNLTRYMSRGWQNPALPAFTNPDPLAENYLPISPYAYCGGDPINRIDPTGEFSIPQAKKKQR